MVKIPGNSGDFLRSLGQLPSSNVQKNYPADSLEADANTTEKDYEIRVAKQLYNFITSQPAGTDITQSVKQEALTLANTIETKKTDYIKNNLPNLAAIEQLKNTLERNQIRINVINSDLQSINNVITQGRALDAGEAARQRTLEAELVSLNTEQRNLRIQMGQLGFTNEIYNSFKKISAVYDAGIVFCRTRAWADSAPVDTIKNTIGLTTPSQTPPPTMGTKPPQSSGVSRLKTGRTTLFVNLVKEFKDTIKSPNFACEKTPNGSYLWSGKVTRGSKKYLNKYELFEAGGEIKLKKIQLEVTGNVTIYVGTYETSDTKDKQLAKIFKAGDSYIAKRPAVIAGGPAAPQKPAPQAAKPAPAPTYGITGSGPGARDTSKKEYTSNGEAVFLVYKKSGGRYNYTGWAYQYNPDTEERVYGWFNPKSRVFTSEARALAMQQETEDQKLERISPKWRGALNNAKDIFAEYNLYKQAYNEDNMTKIYLPRKEKAFLELSWSGGGLTITKKTDDHREKVLETAEYNLEKDKYGTQHLTKLSGGAAEDVFVSYNSATRTKEVLSGELFRIKHQELENRIKETISRAAGEEQKAYYEYSAYYDAHVVSGNNLVYMQDGVLELKTENGKIIAIKHDSTGKVTQANEYYVEAGKVTKKSYVAEKPLEKSEQQKSAVTEKTKEKAFVNADTLAKECKEIMTAKEGSRIKLKDGTMLEVQHSNTLGSSDMNTLNMIVTVKATSATGKVQKIKYEIDFNSRDVGSVFTKTYFDLDGTKETKTKTETIFYDGTDAKIE